MSMASFEQALRKDLPHHWLETEAEVTDCTYARASAYLSADGVDQQLAHYTVGFTYKVDGTTYDGVLSSPVQVEPHDTFLLRYNPDRPAENNSLESELDRPWFNVYMYLVGALVIGVILYNFAHRYLFRLFVR
jgi:Protein of unknown function (DUF3592)